MSSYDLTRITEIKTQLANVNTAINTILLGAQSYTLDTGQSIQKVTRADIPGLKELQSELMNQLEVLEGKTQNTNVIEVIPGW